MMWNRLSFSITSLLVGVIAAPPHPPVSRPVEGTIQLVGRMRVARAAATATTIAGDRVLIVGGMTEGGGALREFEVFDASTNRVVASGEMDESRAGHSATKLSDGRVIFDPRTNAFRPVGGELGQEYAFASAVLLDDGQALVLGGYDNTMRNSDGIWRFRE